jgi:hypothetical protein
VLSLPHSTHNIHRSTSRSPPPLPRFDLLNRFAFRSDNEDEDIIPDIQILLTTATRAVALRTLIINNRFAQFPDSPLSMDNLCNLHLCLTIPGPMCLMQLLESGQQLETLRLDIRSDGGALSSAFRSHSLPGSFPKLREFSFIPLDASENDDGDPDLFPAVTEFVRGHPMLEALCLSYRECPQSPEDFGYTTAIWGVLPSLVNLRTLSMYAPKDLSCALGGWLIPRTVVALDVQVPEESPWEEDCNVRMFLT